MNSPIIGYKVSITTYPESVGMVRNWANAADSRTVIAANVHVLMEAHGSCQFAEVVSGADLVTPDGMPLVWIMRLKGVKGQTRVYGPTLMLHVLEMAAREKIPVGFYGEKDSTLKLLVMRMRQRFPGLEVAYAFSPPFRALNTQESDKIIEEINNSGARILFVGLGCPKQEKWMADHKGKIPVIMLGVGAAFDFHAGTKPQPPEWMQNIGLEWLFRLVHEPRRLARRYLYYNPRFVLLALADLLGILKVGKEED